MPFLADMEKKKMTSHQGAIILPFLATVAVLMKPSFQA